jgi:molybdate-binding protein
MKYLAKIEHRCYENNKKLYALEKEINNALEEVLKFRETEYKEDYWKEALPTTLFVLLNGYDRQAGLEAVKTYLLIVHKISLDELQDKLHRRNKLTDNLRREIEELKEKIKAYQINLNEMNKDNQELQHIIEQHRWDRI